MIRRVELAEGLVELADEGRGDVAVVLLHGFTGSRESWKDLRPALAASRRAVSLDLPGHGGTRVSPPASTFAGAGRLVVAALDAIGVGRFALVGYSMGGRLALSLAATLGLRVAALVVESASAGIEDPAERARRRADDEALARRIEREGIEAFVDFWEQRPLFASLRGLPAQASAWLRRQRLSNDPAGLAASLRGMGAGAQPWLGHRLGEIAAPALAVAGELDAKYVAAAERLARSIPRARLELVSGAGHVPHLERPATFLHLVTEFLNRGGDPCRSPGRPYANTRTSAS